MLTPSTVEEALRLFAAEEVLKLRGSVGDAALLEKIVSQLPVARSAVEFLARCRVAGATLSLIAGEVPMVRVRLRDAKRTRTVGPSSWLPDTLAAFGFLADSHVSIGAWARPWERFDPYVRTLLGQERVVSLEADVQNAKAKVLADEHQVADVRGRLDKKRELERQRQIRIVAQTFKNVPHDLLTEEDVVKLWRENQIRVILES